ncbi:MAG: aminotransferase class III-fold pyridoxal phosphate-dependent enzyme [Phycisphaerales bacterium JB043]
MNIANRPDIPEERIQVLMHEHYGLSGRLKPLVGERDLNVRLDTDTGGSYVVKFAHPEEPLAAIDMQCRALGHLREHSRMPHLYPRVLPTGRGQAIQRIEHDGVGYHMRAVSYARGTPLAGLGECSQGVLAQLGRVASDLINTLQPFAHEAMHRHLDWDAKHSINLVRAHAHHISEEEHRSIVERHLSEISPHLIEHLPSLRMQVIHNDLNDHNIIIGPDDTISGIIDFGDMVHTYRVCELANALAYLLLRDSPWSDLIGSVVRAYSITTPPAQAEAGTLFDFMRLRLCLSVTMSSRQHAIDPDNEYLLVSQKPALEALHRLASQDGEQLREAVLSEIHSAQASHAPLDIMELRGKNLSATLSTSYKDPLKIVRGSGAYLYDEHSNAYLDCVNNVCHVGHCHPRVVEAASAQIARLNTNTRYLHDAIVEYARRLSSTIPDPLEVCFFVNSGSEANDLALRLARTCTGARDVVVVDHAYHGHTQTLIDISPYKFNGRGGSGAPATTHVAEFPDTYRGRFKRDDPSAGEKYAQSVADRFADIANEGRNPAAFIAESIPGVGGQVVLPDGYLEHAHAHARAHGAVCIADEVQVGFGRVGTHMWAFETQNVCPDIVTLGKPIGNGHPMAAVVTTREIADAFNNGMEYFNTFGGNPVSCRVGLAVLDVIEREGLMANALETGKYLMRALQQLSSSFERIGDVRGMGLFIGVELVRDRSTQEPDPELASSIIEHMKTNHVLLSTDGPHNNVLKFKPPICFTRSHADVFLARLRGSFQALC